MRNTLLSAASLVLLGLPLAAQQQIRGVVTDSAAGTPVAGAVVMLLDASGAALARTISGVTGEYGLSASASPVTLRIRRLGFRPRDVPLPTPLPARLDLRLTRVPTLLQPVRVAVAPNCPRRPDREAAHALLEQARAGLLTAVVARSMAPATSMTRLEFRRWMHGTSDDRADSMEVTIDSVGRTPGSYEAVKSARQFLRDGFLLEFGDTVHYLAPDADVLLDDRFGAGYCFHLRREASRRDQLGLAFLPARRARDRVDVDGTLWVDTLRREIRDIEFTYLGLQGRSGEAKPGGRIAFWTMPNGLVFIERWQLRWPRLAAETTYTAESVQPRVREWIEAVEGGGEVARATWADSTTFAGSLGTLHGRALDSDGRGVSNVVIRLRGTDYVTSPGAGGWFEFGQLIPGPYIADVIDPTVGNLGIVFPTALRFDAQRDSVKQARLLVPSASELVHPGCNGTSWPPPNRAPGMVRVVVTMGKKPAPNIPWEIRRRIGADWQYVVERRRTGEDGLVYSCLRYKEDDEIEVRVYPPDAPVRYTKARLGRWGVLIEADLPPPTPRPRNRSTVDRRPGCPACRS